MLTADDITEALRVCYDPELQINIVDLGRIHSIHTALDTEAPGQRTRVHILLLPRDEEPDAMLAAQVVNRLYGLRDLSRAEVAFTDQTWTADRMTPLARAERSKQQGLIQLG